MFVTKENAESE